MATIMNSGETQSKTFKPEADFGVIVRAITGNIIGDWFFHISPDGVNWTQAHDVPFSDSKLVDIIDVPVGFYFRFFGGSGSNLKVDIAYMSARIENISPIESSIID